MKNDGPDRETLVQIFRTATLIKTNNDQLTSAVKSGKMSMIYYPPRGQELIPATLSTHLQPEDYITTIYRGIHDQLSKGVPSRTIWAEYAGRVGGSCKGKGGPMHITMPELGVMVTTGIVGSSMPIALGLALSSQLRKDGRVTVAYFGDGASNIGAFHESMNMAAVWNLPLVFCCQNNEYSEHSKFATFTAGGSVAGRAAGYAMPGITVDGGDPAALWEASREAINRAREGGGPTLIEAKAFRYEGHFLGDDSSYIPAEEMAIALAKDPFPKFRSHLIAAGHATEAELAAIEREVLEEVEEAQAFALASEWPSADELSIDVYAAEDASQRANPFKEAANG